MEPLQVESAPLIRTLLCRRRVTGLLEQRDQEELFFANELSPLPMEQPRQQLGSRELNRHRWSGSDEPVELFVQCPGNLLPTPTFLQRDERFEHTAKLLDHPQDVVALDHTSAPSSLRSGGVHCDGFCFRGMYRPAIRSAAFTLPRGRR